jgi:hypothetical protein
MRMYLVVGLLCVSAVCIADEVTTTPAPTPTPDQAAQVVEPAPTPAPTPEPTPSIAEQVITFRPQIIEQANGFEVRFLFGRGEKMTPEAWQAYLNGILDLLCRIDNQPRTDSEKRELIAAVFMDIMKNSNREDIVELWGLNFTTPAAEETAPVAPEAPVEAAPIPA